MADLNKEKIYSQCVSVLHSKIELVQEELAAIQEDANKESKSSAGDKYETGRAMAQLQKDNTSRQLAELLKLKKTLDELELRKHETIQMGSLVQTDVITFFVSISLSEQMENKVYLVSPVSPLCKMFLGKAAGDTVSFRGKDYFIKNVS